MERLLIKFTKEDEAKFIGHLDTMRTFCRAIKRADVPILYSKGFNPRPIIAFAAPLSLGVSSIGEYADIEVEDNSDSKEILERLNEEFPQGMKVIDIITIKDKKPALMASVEGAKYEVRIPCRDISIKECEEIINKIMSDDEILRIKKSKKGPKEINIRPLIVDLSIGSFSKDEIEFDAFVKSGSNGSLSMDILSDVISEYSNNRISGYATTKRKNIFTLKNRKWVDLFTFYK